MVLSTLAVASALEVQTNLIFERPSSWWSNVIHSTASMDCKMLHFSFWYEPCMTKLFFVISKCQTLPDTVGGHDLRHYEWWSDWTSSPWKPKSIPGPWAFAAQAEIRQIQKVQKAKPGHLWTWREALARLEMLYCNVSGGLVNNAHVPMYANAFRTICPMEHAQNLQGDDRFADFVGTAKHQDKKDRKKMNKDTKKRRKR